VSECICPLTGYCEVRQIALKVTHQTICRENKPRIDALLNGTPYRPPKDLRQRLATCRTNVRPPEPVGDFLESRIDGLLKIKSGRGCRCQTLKAKMNAWGIKGCQRNRVEIISGLMSSRQTVIDAIGERFGVVAGMAASLAPATAIQAGAEWLLDSAIEDARKSESKVEVPEVTTQQKITGHCSAITSVSPNPLRAARQLLCIQSWLRAGIKVIVVNSSDELSAMELPTGVTGVACDDLTTLYDRRTQFVSSLILVGIETGRPFMLINSDIEISGDVRRIDEALQYPDKLTIGIRHNYHPGRKQKAFREPSGLDVFLMTPELAATVPQAPFGIGKPVWDYWLPLHFKTRGTAFNWIDSPLFWHEKHRLGWTRKEWEIGKDFLNGQYGVELGYASGEFRASLNKPSMTGTSG